MDILQGKTMQGPDSLKRVLDIIAGVRRKVGCYFAATQQQKEDCEAHVSVKILTRWPIQGTNPEGWVSTTAWGEALHYFEICAKEQKSVPAELGEEARCHRQSGSWETEEEHREYWGQVAMVSEVLLTLPPREREVLEAWQNSTHGEGTIVAWGRQKGYSRSGAFALLRRAKRHLWRSLLQRGEFS